MRLKVSGGPRLIPRDGADRRFVPERGVLNSSIAGETGIVDRTGQLKSHQDSSTASFADSRGVMSLLASVDNYNFPTCVTGLHVPNGLSGAAEGEGPINDRNDLAQLVHGAQDIQIRI